MEDRSSISQEPIRRFPQRKVYYFSEFPYHEYPDEAGDKYPSLRPTFPNSYFNPEVASDLFKRYFDEC